MRENKNEHKANEFELISTDYLTVVIGWYPELVFVIVVLFNSTYCLNKRVS